MSSTFPKFLVTVVVLVMISGSLTAQSTRSEPELQALMLAYKSRVKQDVETPRATAQAELSQNYIKALERAQQENTLKGKLDEAAALKAEKEAVAANHAQDLPALQPGLRELPPLRRKYLDAEQALRGSMQRKLEPLQKELVRQLDALAVKLARAGKADAALDARQLAKSYSENTGSLEGDWVDQTRKVTPKPKSLPIVINKREIVNTEESFTPPIEIEVVAKVESLDLRLGFAADQVIFNWERKPDELRIDGGPADQIYTPMQGEFPKGKFAVIRWFVDKGRQTISVDGKQRFEHKGDYSGINRPISIQAFGSEVEVQSIKTRRPASP